MATEAQTGRLISVDTPLGQDKLILLRYTGYESLSTPFCFELEMFANQAIAFDQMVGQPATITVALGDGSQRFINGVVSRFSQTGSDRHHRYYSAQLVPWLWLLTRRADCRIFQNKSVPNIIEEVFKFLGFADYELSLTKTYNPREYCVQYRETDFNFVSRLMEYHGIYYFFRHEAQKHVLVLADSTSAVQPCPGQDKAEFELTEHTHEWDRDVVKTWQCEQELRPGSWALTDFNFKTPLTNVSASTDTMVKSWKKQLQIYDYPAGCETKSDTETVARLRMECEESQQLVARATSNCRAFLPGFQFELVDHPDKAQNRKWLIAEVEHEATASGYRSGQADLPAQYSNRVVCIPAEVPYRPPRVARRPFVQGPQTALVVGPQGEEIYPDKYGRVKVQFHWDRLGKYDAESSCWIRVSQAWAGKTWGAMSLPRIGQEVIVDFLEGDPDQPIITGRVYNGEEMPPYKLPDQMTMTTLKTNSSKGGGGFNEFRFEDKKGEEQIFMHAEKNLDIRVKNNEYETVCKDLHLIVEQDKFEQTKNDHHETIDRDYAQSVGRDHHLKVTGKQAVEVGGSQSLKVSGDVAEEFGMNYSNKVSMATYLKAGMTIVLEAPTGITLKCGGNSVVLDPVGVTVKGNLVVVQGSLVNINSGPGSPPASGQACSLTAPMKPKEVHEADKADPGEMSKIKEQQMKQQTGKYGLVALTPHKPPNPDEAAAEEKKHWIEVKLVDQDNKPVAGEVYKVILPDGSTVAEGCLDEKGHARVEGLASGNCKVIFPQRDKNVWKPK
ncbi:MAG: type VI secretion system tip protein TssI/VgrG [Terriglobales bacterium]